MEWSVVERKELSFSSIELKAGFIGRDVLVCVEGGDSPHIGCTVQTVPRQSLTGDGSVGVTSSVLNLTGHKDEVLCRRLAEQISREVHAVVVCTGGFHMDGMEQEQIEAVVKAMVELAGTVKVRLARLMSECQN